MNFFWSMLKWKDNWLEKVDDNIFPSIQEDQWSLQREPFESNVLNMHFK